MPPYDWQLHKLKPIAIDWERRCACTVRICFCRYKDRSEIIYISNSEQQGTQITSAEIEIVWLTLVSKYSDVKKTIVTIIETGEHDRTNEGQDLEQYSRSWPETYLNSWQSYCILYSKGIIVSCSWGGGFLTGTGDGSFFANSPLLAGRPRVRRETLEHAYWVCLWPQRFSKISGSHAKAPRELHYDRYILTSILKIACPATRDTRGNLPPVSYPSRAG